MLRRWLITIACSTLIDKVQIDGAFRHNRGMRGCKIIYHRLAALIQVIRGEEEFSCSAVTGLVALITCEVVGK